MLHFDAMLHTKKEPNKFNQYRVMCVYVCVCAEITTGKSEGMHLAMP